MSEATKNEKRSFSSSEPRLLSMLERQSRHTQTKQNNWLEKRVSEEPERVCLRWHKANNGPAWQTFGRGDKGAPLCAGVKRPSFQAVRGHLVWAPEPGGTEPQVRRGPEEGRPLSR